MMRGYKPSNSEWVQVNSTHNRIGALMIYGTVNVILDTPLDSKERLKRIDSAKVRRIGEALESYISEGPTIVQLPFDSN